MLPLSFYSLVVKVNHKHHFNPPDKEREKAFFPPQYQHDRVDVYTFATILLNKDEVSRQALRVP